MPCPSIGPKMFCAGPNFLSQSKNLIAFSYSLKNVFWHKNQIGNHLFVWHTIFGTPQNVYQFLVCPRKFGPAQNVLGPVEGQGISVTCTPALIKVES